MLLLFMKPSSYLYSFIDAEEQNAFLLKARLAKIHVLTDGIDRKQNSWVQIKTWRFSSAVKLSRLLSLSFLQEDFELHSMYDEFNNSSIFERIDDLGDGNVRAYGVSPIDFLEWFQKYVDVVLADAIFQDTKPPVVTSIWGLNGEKRQRVGLLSAILASGQSVILISEFSREHFLNKLASNGKPIIYRQYFADNVKNFVPESCLLTTGYFPGINDGDKHNQIIAYHDPKILDDARIVPISFPSVCAYASDEPVFKGKYAVLWGHDSKKGCNKGSMVSWMKDEEFWDRLRETVSMPIKSFWCPADCDITDRMKDHGVECITEAGLRIGQIEFMTILKFAQFVA